MFFNHLITAFTQVNYSLLSTHLQGLSVLIILLIPYILMSSLVFISIHRSSIYKTFLSVEPNFFKSFSPLPLSFPPSLCASLQAKIHFCTSFPSVSLVFPSALNYVSHQRKQCASKYFTQDKNSAGSAFAHDILEMPGGAKRANTLRSTLWEITVKTDVPIHF